MRTAVALALALSALQGCVSTQAALYAATQAERIQPRKLINLGAHLSESSGLAAVGRELWTMNDSGGAAQLIALDLSGERSRTVSLKGATNFDWEALAQSDDTLYIVDCGNNRGDRIWLQLYAVPLQQLSASSATATRIDFRWGDVEYAVDRRAHNNDCEAAAWVEDELWLLTKNWQDQATRLYRMRPGAGGQHLQSSEQYAVGGLITGADYSVEHQMLALLGYGKGLQMLQPFIWLVPVVDKGPSWSQAKRYLLGASGQWEAISWQGDSLLISSEESVLGGAQVAQLSLPFGALSH